MSPPTAVGRKGEGEKVVKGGKSGSEKRASRSRSPSPTGRSRSESIIKLQKLQQKMSVPRLGGTVRHVGVWGVACIIVIVGGG